MMRNRHWLIAVVLSSWSVARAPAAGQERAYVATGMGALQIIDTAANTLVSTSLSQSVDLALSPDGSVLYGATLTTVQFIDAATEQVTASVPVPDYVGAGALRLTPESVSVDAEVVINGCGLSIRIPFAACSNHGRILNG